MSLETNTKKYEVAHGSPPKEGGYGYIILVAVTIVAITVSLPLGVFGIVFGKFLATLGDETTGTSLANGIFNTVLSLTGLVANVLLNKWSCRNVGLLGAMFCVIGCFSLVFVDGLIPFIVCFGVFQGFGYGLLLPASLTALNNAFDNKLSFMMSLSQALMVGCCMVMPICASAIMDTWGFRGAVLCLGGITLFNIPAAAVLTRFEWKSCKASNQYALSNNNNNIENAYLDDKKFSIECSKSTIDLNKQYWTEPLLKRHNSLRDVTRASPNELKVLHIADRISSIASLNRNTVLYTDSHIDIVENKLSIWASILSSMDFSLLTSPKYLNMSIGLTLSFTSDVCFITMLPVVLAELGFSQSEIALTMSIFFGSDLVSRILLSILSSFATIKSRHLVLGGTLFSVIFRVVFIWSRTSIARTGALAALGFLRCFIQTPLPLVISEAYPNQFATAFSLYMVVCGLITLVFGPLMGIVKTATGSNAMVCHLLTSCYVVCVISWVCEMALNLRKKKTLKHSCQENFENKV